MSYRQYCRRYSEWADSKQLTFHIQRYPGVNLELDYAGKQLYLHNRRNPEETTKVTIFIAALTYSDYFYAEGMTECDIRNWIRVNNNALAYFGGVTPTITPEGHVKIVTMHILMDMEDMVFYSLDDLNRVLMEKVDVENRKPFEGLTYSRYDLFTTEEKETLLPLPTNRFEYLERKTVKVAQDFSFTFDKVHYSMPRKYLRQELEIRAGEKEIYVYNKHGDLIRTHKRSYTPRDWVIIPSDMPAEYKDYGYWTVPYFQQKASAIGPSTRALIDAVIRKYAYPVQSFRSCFGILRYAEKYSPEALERCCKDAVLAGKCNYSYICNTISTYHKEPSQSTASQSKPNEDAATTVSGTYKDDDSKYSLKNLLKRQETEAGYEE